MNYMGDRNPRHSGHECPNKTQCGVRPLGFHPLLSNLYRHTDCARKMGGERTSLSLRGKRTDIIRRSPVGARGCCSEPYWSRWFSPFGEITGAIVRL